MTGEGDRLRCAGPVAAPDARRFTRRSEFIRQATPHRTGRDALTNLGLNRRRIPRIWRRCLQEGWRRRVDSRSNSQLAPPLVFKTDKPPSASKIANDRERSALPSL